MITFMTIFIIPFIVLIGRKRRKRKRKRKRKKRKRKRRTRTRTRTKRIHSLFTHSLLLNKRK